MKKLVKSYIWSIAVYGVETWTFGKVDQKHLDTLLNVALEKDRKDNWTVCVNNKEV
jgi:hypothetical protein